MFLIFAILALLFGLLIIATICVWANEDDMEFPARPLLICLLCFAFSALTAGLLLRQDKDRYQEKCKIEYAYRQAHKFDSDVVILEGQKEEINSEIAEYAAHGYDPVGGCSINKWGEMSQTMHRKK